ncbi:hypothetical protein ACCQ08_25695 [Comamonas sp. SY3]|uniref:hypothetical protein n=1 Tax=Comamonas sp. SY3 TaxID=3243601 RepID=UPI0035940CC0
MTPKLNSLAPELRKTASERVLDCLEKVMKVAILLFAAFGFWTAALLVRVAVDPCSYISAAWPIAWEKTPSAHCEFKPTTNHK